MLCAVGFGVWMLNFDIEKEKEEYRLETSEMWIQKRMERIRW